MKRTERSSEDISKLISAAVDNEATSDELAVLADALEDESFGIQRHEWWLHHSINAALNYQRTAVPPRVRDWNVLADRYGAVNELSTGVPREVPFYLQYRAPLAMAASVLVLAVASLTMWLNFPGADASPSVLMADRSVQEPIKEVPVNQTSPSAVSAIKLAAKPDYQELYRKQKQKNVPVSYTEPLEPFRKAVKNSPPIVLTSQ